MVTVGNGKSGSWQMRGDQLGRAIGAEPIPWLREPAGIDRLIMIKRVDHGLARRSKAARVPIIYDIVDAWQGQGLSGRESALAWLRNCVRTLRPSGLVASTAAMAADCCEFNLPVLALPHHARPIQLVNPIRQEVSAVGYEGSEKYIKSWYSILEQECARRGWKFVVNPERLADVDIVVAMRDDTSYAARHWKSNVKLANAQATGTPCVLNREMGYLETASGAERFADDLDELRQAFDELTPYAARIEASLQLRSKELGAGRVELPTIAATYKAWLCSSRF